MADSIVDFLRAKHLLLVLDNCEHLLDAAADLAERIVEACPEVRVLATSREGLAVDGEQVIPLRSLGLPDDGADAGALEATAAVQPFIERARAAPPGGPRPGGPPGPGAVLPGPRLAAQGRRRGRVEPPMQLALF